MQPSYVLGLTGAQNEHVTQKFTFFQLVEQ